MSERDLINHLKEYIDELTPFFSSLNSEKIKDVLNLTTDEYRTIGAEVVSKIASFVIIIQFMLRSTKQQSNKERKKKWIY